MEQTFVMHTETQREHVAGIQVVKLGLPSALIPMHTTFKREGNRQVPDRTTVLFPRWIFVKIDLVRDEDLLGELNHVRGSARVQKGKPSVLLCGASDKPQPIPQSAMDFILSRERERIESMTPKPFVSPFAPGQKVKVIDGPFAGLEATIDSDSPKERVWALLEILGRKVSTEFDAGNLQATG